MSLPDQCCGFWNPASAKPCDRAARRLVLSDGFGGLIVRYLCGEHSDFIEAPEATIDRPLSLADRAALRELGIAPC